ncbi:hypothetical protein ACEWY4_021155 [Coilia grayii]|uniref:Uncharacterized protein n=1 Tax=Coilia grayii TaxID=363190 RepID=A0ABD1J8C7_9TELE
MLIGRQTAPVRVVGGPPGTRQYQMSGSEAFSKPPLGPGVATLFQGLQEKEVLERCRGEDMAAVTFQWQRRELQLTQQLQQMDTQHEHTVGELDALLSSQSDLIHRLKEECRSLGQKLEEVTESSRSEVEQLTVERAHLQECVEKLRGRCHDMEEQCVQHGTMHQRMKKRLTKKS